MHTSISLSTLSVALLLLTPSTIAQTTTVTGVSEIGDGQIQAPTGAASSSTWSYENPFTIYTTQTNSLGVITGQPSVVTSQPEVVTSQPPSATLPTLSGYWYGNSTTTSSSQTVSQPTTISTSIVSGSGSSGATGSSTASATFAQATGGASSNKIVGAGLGLLVLACGFSML